MKLLIIEDDEFLRRAYEITAKRAGFTVTVAADGAVGLINAIAGSPDVILTDVQMPNVDGMEVIQTLKKDPRVAHVPIVVFSSTVGPEEAEDFLDAGAAAYYSKATTSLDVVMDRLRALSLPDQH